MPRHRFTAAEIRAGFSNPRFQQRIGRGPPDRGLRFRVSVGLTEAEFDAIRKKTRRPRMTQSGWIREAVRKALAGKGTQ